MPSKSKSSRPYVLRGSRVGFKTLHRDDLPFAIEWFQSMRLIAHLSTRGKPETVESETAWFERALKNDDGVLHFAIFELKRERFIGTVSLFDIQPGHCATLGIAIGDPTCWNRGFGREAVRLMVEYGFYFMNLWNIRLGVYSFNERARRSYVKAGFREVGRFRGTKLLGGKRFDDIWMDITRDEVDLSRMRGVSGVDEA
jgi:RimJ/RimL family protein N-acetyltransferase